MDTNTGTEPVTPPADAQPDQQREQPRDEHGRFTALPEPPTVGQAAVPTPPAPRVDPNTAIEFYERLSNPQTRAEQFLQLGREYGFIPEGLTPDQVQEALYLYQDYQRQLAGEQPQAQGPVGAPPLPEPPTGGAQPDGSWQPQAPATSFDPDRFAEQIEQRLMQAWERREQDQRMQEEFNRRLDNLQAAVGKVAEDFKLSEGQHQALLHQVALQVDAAVNAGRPVDFSVDALGGYAREILELWRGVGEVREQEDTQAAVAQHREIAPQTTTPAGPAMSGAPGGPRGIRGVAERIKASQAARASAG